jgi:uncharacterized membrane protein
MQRWVSYFLIIGTLTALFIVTVGGVMYLLKTGHAPLNIALFNTYQPMDFVKTLQDLQLSTPLGIIELGLLLLIATQILRLVWMFGFYIQVHDHWFAFFTGFILCVILYSLLMMR